MSIPDSMTRSVPLWAFLLTAVMAFGGAAMVTGAAFERLEAVEREADSLSDLKEDVRELKTDVKWIRDRLK